MLEGSRVAAQNVSQDAIDAFCLSVGLGVSGGRHRELGTELIEDSAPKVGSKARIAIGHEFLR